MFLDALGPWESTLLLQACLLFLAESLLLLEAELLLLGQATSSRKIEIDCGFSINTINAFERQSMTPKDFFW